MHRLELLDIARVTYNVRRYRLQRPQGYDFVAGQATEMALDQDGWRDEKRPFTFTGLSGDPYLEFTIKNYDSHDGVTKRIGLLQPGDHLLVDDPWETIPYHGKGTFIAGGAGITPFLALLRKLQKDGDLKGHRLIFSNKTTEDIILREELEVMSGSGLDLDLVITGDPAPAMINERIGRTFLENHVSDYSGYFYLCGPDKMTADIATALVALGASEDRVIIAS